MLSKRMKVTHDEVFPHGAYLVGEVTQVVDFDKSTRETKYQQFDKDTGLPMWQVDVLDADPEAKRASRAVTIKFAVKVQPVPPANDSESPFTPVVFEGMTALPYVEQVSESFSRIAWSFRALAMRAPGSNAHPSAVTPTSSNSTDGAAKAGPGTSTGSKAVA